MSRKMCKLRNAKMGVDPTFTWSNKAWCRVFSLKTSVKTISRRKIVRVKITDKISMLFSPNWHWVKLIVKVENLLKTNRFSSFRTKSLNKKNLRRNLDFCGNYFLWPLLKMGTNMESNAAVTLHFEVLAVNNYLFFKNMCAFVCEKSQVSNCSILN